jgi:hypothetical protein
MYWVGNCPELTVSAEMENLEHKESYSGNNLQDLRINIGKTVTLSFILEDFMNQNLALALRGLTVQRSLVLNGTVLTLAQFGPGSTGYNNAGTAAVTDVPTINNGAVFVLVDSQGRAYTGLPNDLTVALTMTYAGGTGTAPTPPTLTLGTDFTLDRASGTIVFLRDVYPYGSPSTVPNAGSTITLTATLTAITSGTAAAPILQTAIGMFMVPDYEYALRFAGMNSADTGAPFTVDLWRVMLDPTTELSLISDELTQISIEGSALFDPTKLSTNSLGQFGAVYPGTAAAPNDWVAYPLNPDVPYGAYNDNAGFVTQTMPLTTDTTASTASTSTTDATSGS